MENQTKVRQADALANFIRIVGVLCFIATGLNVVRWSYAVFAGIACFLLAQGLRQWLIAKQ